MGTHSNWVPRFVLDAEFARDFLMLSDLTFLTNEPERKLSARLNDLLTKSSRFDCLVGYFYLSGFNLIQNALEPCEKIRILIGLQTERDVYEALQRAKTQG